MLIPAVSLFFDIYGKYKAKLIVKDVLAGNSLTLKTYEGDLPGYMEVSGPTYRGMVSTARRQKDIRVSVKFNTLAVNTADEVSDTELVLPALKARKLTSLYGSPKASVYADGAIKVKLGICGRAVWTVE